MLRALLIWPIASLATLFWGSLSLAGSLFDGSGRFAHYCMVAWSRINLRLAGARLMVEGLEHVQRAEPQIFASNHQSMIDIIALAAALPVPFRFVAKAELFEIPFLGWHMRRAGYLAIVRDAPRVAARALLAAADKVRSGVNTVIFPEGTRSPDASLLPFKGGGFLLALKAQVPVVPIGIWGTARIVGKGSLRVKPGPAVLVIGAPIRVASRKSGDRDALAAEVRQAIEACMARAQVLAGGGGPGLSR